MDSDERRTQGKTLRPEGARPPQPEGPEEIRKKFEDLNKRPPWDVLGHASDLVGRLDLETGAVVVTVAEVANALAGDFVEDALDVPFSGWLTLLLPLLLGFFHHKKKGKDEGSPASGGLAGEAMTPEAVAAAVKSSRRSIFERAWDKLHIPE